jgi:hypothetical protein
MFVGTVIIVLAAVLPEMINEKIHSTCFRVPVARLCLGPEAGCCGVCVYPMCVCVCVFAHWVCPGYGSVSAPCVCPCVAVFHRTPAARCVPPACTAGLENNMIVDSPSAPAYAAWQNSTQDENKVYFDMYVGRGPW